MATDFVFPTNERLSEIAQDKMPALMANRPIFEHLPIKNIDESEVIWEQMDNYIGLQQLRGLNGAPSRVKKSGVSRYRMQPGYYGEDEMVDELELTRRRQPGTFGNPVSIEDLVLRIQDKLLQRRLDRIEQIGWTLLSTGTFSVATPDGGILHTDTWTFQTYTASVSWSTLATATPLQDFRTVKLKHRGHSVVFDKTARAYMNGTTYNYLVANNNSADLFGRRNAGLATIQNLTDVNGILLGDDLPTIVIYDQGYFDDNSSFQLFIPDNVVIVIGKRPAGQVLGNYVMTRHASNPSLAPGAFMAVVDSADHGKPLPRDIQVIDAHNGGPTIEYPSSVVVMSV